MDGSGQCKKKHQTREQEARAQLCHLMLAHAFGLCTDQRSLADYSYIGKAPNTSGDVYRGRLGEMKEGSMQAC